MTKNIFFISIFIFFCGVIGLNFNKFNADIFSLLDIKTDDITKISIKNQQNSTKFNFNILVKDKNDAKNIDLLAKNSNLFLHNDLNISKILKLKLALFNSKNIDELKSGEFFYNSAKKLFGINRTFSVNDDFFSMINLPNLFDDAKFDINTGFLKTENFYLLNYELKKSFNQNDLLNLYQNIKKFKNTHINSSQIYNIYSKNTAQKESFYLGLLSLFSTLVFIFLAFGSTKIFYILIIIIFSLICGLGSTLLVFDEVSFLSLVISTSLIGLIVDFAMHFLSSNLEKQYKKDEIFKFKNLFLIALFITTTGYTLFFLSDMKFLHQIAFISISSLCFSFIFTYFIFPNLIKNAYFKKTKIFSIFFYKYIKFLELIKVKFILLLAIIFIVFISFSKLDFKDDIKNYVKLPQILMNDSMIFSKELKLKNDFIMVDKNLSISLAKELENNDLTKDLFFISRIINTQKTQNDIKSLFKDASKNENILNIYQNIGFNKSDINDKFNEIQNIDILSLDEILNTLNIDKNLFFIQDKELLKAQIFIKNDDFYQILNKYNAVYVDYLADINKNLNSIKIQALTIKIIGLFIAFVVLWKFFGLKTSITIISLIVFSSLLSLFVFISLGLKLDIFMIFGFILASAAGIDYTIFALNKKLTKNERIFGIIAASFTSVLSFFTLIFSSTTAVFSFGLSVSLNLLILMILSSFLAIKSNQTSNFRA